MTRRVHVDPGALQRARKTHEPALRIQQDGAKETKAHRVVIVCPCGHEVAAVTQIETKAHVVVTDDAVRLVES